MSRSDGPAIRAAGGVVWRVRDGLLEVGLVHRPRYDDWSLPKGKLHNGESELRAAVREVNEELGAEVAVSRLLARVEYAVAVDRSGKASDRPGGDKRGSRSAHKTVAFWTMRATGGDFTPNEEVDEVAWLAPAEAAQRLTYAVEQEVLAEFRALPVPDSVVVLVRHAKAGRRRDWKGDDALRPLDRHGRAQADRLADLLSCFRPDAVVSADRTRCVQTVEPLAARLSLAVRIETAFDDDAYEVTPLSTETALLTLAKPARVTVVGSQGLTIPGLVERLAPHVESSDTRKAAAWALSFVDGAVIAADYYEDAV